ncbi:MAG: type II toxin-antitoxin system prevent-host-death family antitoxin [Terracidiphilus sp.]
MRTFNIHEAKTHLSRLVDEAERGQPFLIAKAGKPKVKVVRMDEPRAGSKSRIGFMKGAYTLPADYSEVDKMLDRQVEKLMAGKPGRAKR